MPKPDRPDDWLKAALGAVFAAGLALILWPLYVVLHRNHNLRLERRER